MPKAKLAQEPVRTNFLDAYRRGNSIGISSALAGVDDSTARSYISRNPKFRKAMATARAASAKELSDAVYQAALDKAKTQKDPYPAIKLLERIFDVESFAEGPKKVYHEHTINLIEQSEFRAKQRLKEAQIVDAQVKKISA